MAIRLKTSQRIANSSLELFNQLGERSVSTNHIAAHMEISPGNLYYHFPNKQAIISVLFSEYEALVLSFLHPPQGRLPTVADKRQYLQQLLDAMWPTLEVGGILLYATCSTLPTENTEVIEAFLARTPGARELDIAGQFGIKQPHGRQLLAQEGGHDGFYYAKLIKIAAARS